MAEEKALEVQEVPREVLKRAWEAAKQLQTIISKRKDTVIIGGKQYLRFEDWQTLGRFTNITAKVTDTRELREGDKLIGFLARAVALRDGIEISAAEAECCFDEDNWRDKPRFQLRSMAQTRAASKSLRNCLSWIAVLAGFSTVPAEEVKTRPAPRDQEELFD